MPMLSGVGKSIGRNAAMIGAVALGTGLLLDHHNKKRQEQWDPNDPNKPGLASTIKEGLLDFGLGDKYADIDLMGFPARLSDFIPNPFALPLPAPIYDTGRFIDDTRFAYKHGSLQGITDKVYYQDKLNSWYQRKAENAIKNRTSTIDYGLSNADDLPYDPGAQSADIRYVPMSSYPNRTSISNGVKADGSMVFGLYNLRMR